MPSDGSGYAAKQFVERLLAAGSELGKQLDRAHELPLRTYLTELIPPSPRDRTSTWLAWPRRSSATCETAVKPR